ncbi:MAG: ABC transporter ATP-binding protein [Paracoccaceae bacterium]|nr:ABC transporter ATP-binding protein [Paracoccaceae bacterium]
MRAFFSGFIKPYAAADGPPPQSLWAFIRWSLTGAWPAILFGAFMGALVGVLESLGALFIGWVIDEAVIAPDPAAYFQANWWLVIMTALFFIAIRPAAMGLSAAVNAISLGPNLFPQVVMRLKRHTLGHSIRFFDDDFAGRLAQKHIQSGHAITEIILESTNSIAFCIATVIGATLVLGSVDWRLSLLLAVWLVGYGFFIRWYLPRIRRLSRARAEARANVTGQIVDTLSNMATVKLFAHVGREERAAEQSVDTFREKALDFGVMAAVFRALLMLLAGALPVMLIGAALIFWQQGTATPGDIAVAGVLSTRIAQMSGWFSFTMMGIFANIGEAEDGMRTLAPSHDLVDDPNANAVEDADGSIHFDNVTYHYGKETGGGLDGFDLKIKPGEKIALVGQSGAGKTTVLSLLLRLYDVEEGAIRMGDRDIRDLTQDALRRQIAMVRQETAMFNRSARENIFYGRPEATEEEMLKATAEAEAHDFILELEDLKGRKGYDAFLGERGVKLSGGQRQRIALARAILKDAPVLALDEATSALDSEVEAAIQSSLDRLMEGKTVIAIAHRLSTIARMDRIVVMEAGRVAEIGTHNELLAKGGLYAMFWNRQSGGFIGVEEIAAAE